MNDVGRAHTGQRNLSEASSDLAGDLGLDLVGEVITSVFRFALGIKPKPAAGIASSDAFELPVGQDD